MLNQEALDRVDTIIEPGQNALAVSLFDAELARQQLADSKVAVGVAKSNVKAAEQERTRAEMEARESESGKQRSERGVESAAKNIAVTIIQDPELEPVTKTLFSLIYNSSSTSWQEGTNAYDSAVDRGKVALSSIIGQLRPDAPILYFEDDRVTADTATDESLVAYPPTADNKTGDYVSIVGGSLSIVMPDSPKVKPTEQGLVIVEHGTVEAVLMSCMYGYDLELLESAAENNKWLVIGEQAVVSKLEQLEPLPRFVALTALNAVGVELNIQVDPELKEKTEQHLIALLAYLASGAGQETTTRSEISHDEWTGSSHRTQFTQDTPLTRMARSIDKQSMRAMAQTLGISKETLRAQVETALKARVASDTTSLDQLSKDVQSITSLDSILASIF